MSTQRYRRAELERGKAMATYYDNWRTEPYACTNCGWRGLGNETAHGETFLDLFEIECPKCNCRLGTVTFPTLKESRENWDKVAPADRIAVELVEAERVDFERRQLRAPDKLPDLPDKDLILIWDKVGDDTVLKHGERVLWQEPAFFDGYMRYLEVVEILLQKYRARLKDVAPTPASELYLYGDSLAAPSIVKECRERLQSRQDPGALRKE